MAKAILIGQDSPVMNQTITTHVNDTMKHMTTADRAKIDGIAAGATKTTITNNLTTTVTGTALDAAQGKVLKEQLDQCFTSVSNGKSLVAAAITDKGVITASDATFETMANNIKDMTTIQLEINEIWQLQGSATVVTALVTDSQGNVYAGGDTVRKINPSGQLVWSFADHKGDVGDLAVDTLDNVYSVGSGSHLGDFSVRKISSSGVQIWKETWDANSVYAVCTDVLNNVYTGGSKMILRKISSSGTQKWSFTGHTNYILDIDIDSQGNIYSCGQDKTVRKINTEGAQVWSFTGHTDIVDCLVVDSQDYIYSGGRDSIKKMNTNGQMIWSFASDSELIRAMETDDIDNIVYSDNTALKKINPRGQQTWRFPSGETVRAIAWGERNQFYYGGNDKIVRKAEEYYY